MNRFADFSAGSPGLDWLGTERFAEMAQAELPTAAQESWRYSSLRFLNNFEYRQQRHLASGSLNTLAEQILEGIPGNGLILFVNGRFALTRGLPGKVFVHELSKLSPLQQARCMEIVRSTSGQENHYFEGLNRVLAKDGIFIEAEGDEGIYAPVSIFFLMSQDFFDGSSGSALSAFPRIIIDVKKDGRLSLQEESRAVAGDFRYLSCPAYSMAVAEGGELTLVRMLDSTNHGAEISSIKASSHGRVNLLSLDCGAGTSRSEIAVDLLSQSSSAAVDGLILAIGDGQRKDHRSVVRHLACSSCSTQLYKTIAAANGIGSFAGCIHIAKGAAKAQAEQLSRNLMLDDKGEINCQPQLRIDADDVKCSHGASYSRPNDQELFYLLSRGIRKDDALGMLTLAFAEEVLIRFRGFADAPAWQGIALAAVRALLMDSKRKVLNQKL
jgi:Fe-S cluster assembly protein SufD